MEITGTGIERAKIRAKLLREKGQKVYIHWTEEGVPTCPICSQRIDKNGNCPCGAEKHSDPAIKQYIKCFDMDFESFKKEAERANKRYEAKRKKEA